MGLLDDAIREHLDLMRAHGVDPTEVARLEHEALGPVRRDSIYEAHEPDTLRAAESPSTAVQFMHPDDDPEEYLEDLQEHGYIDSTAPHPHLAHAEPGAPPLDTPRLDFAGAHELAPEPQHEPRRRFLRRSRPASLREPAQPPSYEQVARSVHDADDDDDGLFPPQNDEATVEHELPAQHEEPPTAGAAAEDAAPHEQQAPPPVQFAPAPQRPRFNAEPRPEPQATREFDVQQHLESETQDEAEPPRPPAQAPSPSQPPEPADSADDEDLLEGTPDFLQDAPEHDRLWFEQKPPSDFDFGG